MKLTTANINKLPPGEIIKDDLVTGLHLRKGVKRSSWYLCYRDEYGKQRRPTIGTWPVLEPKMARQKALAILRAIQMGDLASATMTLAQVHDAYMDEEGRKLKPTSLSVYNSIWNKYLAPSLGKKQISKITYNDWQDLHASMPRVMANRMLAYAGNLYKHAKKLGAFKNEPPSKLVTTNSERARTRRLDKEELRRFGHCIKCEMALTPKAQRFATLLMMYLYTSCRKNELVDLQWQCINWHDHTIELPDSKTGFRIIPLSNQAVMCLRSLGVKDEGSVFGFKAREIKDMWSHFKTVARLPDLRIHDLRRSVASFGLNDGLNLKEVGGLLGHANQATTEGYAYLEIETTRNNANKIADTIDGVINCDSLYAEKAKANAQTI